MILEKAFKELIDANTQWSIKYLELQKENELLRECVEFYADEKGRNWGACRDDDTYKTCCHMISEISGGEKARECLAKLEET